MSVYGVSSCAPAWLQRDGGGLVVLQQAAEIRTKAPSLFEGLFWRHVGQSRFSGGSGDGGGVEANETGLKIVQTGCFSVWVGSGPLLLWNFEEAVAASVFFGGVFWARACKNNSVSWRLTSPLPQTTGVDVNIQLQQRLNAVKRMKHVSFCYMRGVKMIHLKII